MSCASSELSLPPNVTGKKRGTIELSLSEIRWKSTKAYPSVKIHIFWWGQSESLRNTDLGISTAILK